MIRPFALADISQIYELGSYFGDNFAKTNNLEEIYQDKYTKILVYEDNGQIVAFLMYTELLESIDIIDIIVAKDYQRKKIASCLLDYMISGMPDTVKLITLEVRVNNLPAINLYQKFGFKVYSVRKKYYKDEDAYLMGRKVEK